MKYHVLYKVMALKILSGKKWEHGKNDGKVPVNSWKVYFNAHITGR
jgi:hypothetical protein